MPVRLLQKVRTGASGFRRFPRFNRPRGVGDLAVRARGSGGPEVNNHSRVSCYLVVWLWLALWLPATDCLADTLRVTSWNLQAMTTGTVSTNGSEPRQFRLLQAAAALKKLAPDMILLQHVRDWRLCEQLARALKPAEYHVLVCSAFPEPQAGKGSLQQVAILAKQPAYLSWAQPWKTGSAAPSPGGFAFSALERGGKRLGLFSLESAGGPASTRQLLAQVVAVRDWVTNRVQVFVIAGTFDTNMMQSLEAEGFGDVVADSAAGQDGNAGNPPPGGARADRVFVLSPRCATNAFLSPGAGARHQPVTCDLELDAARLAAQRAAMHEATAVLEPVPVTPAPVTKEALSNTSSRRQAGWPQTLALLPLVVATLALGAVLVLGLVVWAIARRTRAPVRALLASDPTVCAGTASSYTVVVGTGSGIALAPPAEARAPKPQPVIQLEVPDGTQTKAEVLLRRTEAVGEREARTKEVLREGLISDLSRWLKRKLLRRLITDRVQLIAAQTAATAKALSVEERLARVERQIEEQNRAYQQRIEELTQELAAAREDSRELIRTRIRQVKADMEAARARLLARAKQEE
jgi:hypothetical protein